MLRSHFSVKDLVRLTIFLGGMKLEKHVMRFFLISRVRKYNILDCKHVATPFDSSVHLFSMSNDNGVVNQQVYASIIGCLCYATNCTRPHIACAIGVLCKFTNKTSRDHSHAIEHVMKYLSCIKIMFCFT